MWSSLKKAVKIKGTNNINSIKYQHCQKEEEEDFA